MYQTLQLPWSDKPSAPEAAYRANGCVKTKGTIFILPPPIDVLAETFNALPRTKSRMSAGAVALCKHFERGGASSEHGKPHPFWPLPTGSNDNKTAMASKVLDNLLADNQWNNVMLLHRGVAVYELRNSLGYGARWTLDLEEAPGMVDLEDEKENPSNHDFSSSTHGEAVIDEAAKGWGVVKTSFRGFLEPIEDMNHVLPAQLEAINKP